jgi:uncharacterized membrane protein YphA (DoxX/SURF4 family)
MVVAIAMVDRAFGFFMSWTGNHKSEGFEYHLLLFLLIGGAGAFSVDRATKQSAGEARRGLPDL